MTNAKKKIKRKEFNHKTKKSYPQKKTVKRDKGYIMIKGSIQQKDLTVINIYVPKSGAPIYIVQTLMEKLTVIQ